MFPCRVGGSAMRRLCWRKEGASKYQMNAPFNQMPLPLRKRELQNREMPDLQNWLYTVIFNNIRVTKMLSIKERASEEGALISLNCDQHN